MATYRLQSLGADVAALALGALSAILLAAGGNVGVVRLLAVGHGGSGRVRGLIGVCDERGVRER